MKIDFSKIKNRFPVLHINGKYDSSCHAELYLFKSIEDFVANKDIDPSEIDKEELIASVPSIVLLEMFSFVVNNNLVDDFIQWTKKVSQEENEMLVGELLKDEIFQLNDHEYDYLDEDEDPVIH
jgi:hypothetical protein